MSENFVKICGINSEDIAIHAINANADYLGFIFYPDSPRNISFSSWYGGPSSCRWCSSAPAHSPAPC